MKHKIELNLRYPNSSRRLQQSINIRSKIISPN